MSISSADLKPLKTESQKIIQALNDELGIGIGAEETARRQAAPPKPKGQKPLYHSYFGQYFFWVVTGRGKSEMYGSSAEEYYGPTKSQQHFGSIVQWITSLLSADKEELSFNQYAYLKDLIQQQVKQYGDDAPHFRPVVEWLQEQADKADTYASLFSPPRYNVRTLLDAGERELSGNLNLARPLAPDEQERLEYYQRIEKSRVALAEKEAKIYEQRKDSTQQPTARALQHLARLEKQLEVLALGHLDQLDYNRLQARASRKQSAAEFKRGLEERLLQPSLSGLDVLLKHPGSFQPYSNSETGIFPPRIIFTLAELTREFDANIALCDTPSSRAAYATKQLALFDANRPLVIRHFNPYREMDELKVTAMNEVLNDLRSLYEQHQRHKLQSFRTPVSSPEIAKFSRLTSSKTPSEDNALPIDLQSVEKVSDELASQSKTNTAPESIADLCIEPFELSNLIELLTHLKVIKNGKWHLGELAARNATPKSAFPAAYRILSAEENSLMRKVDDTVWAKLFRNEFQVKLSPKTANYKENMPDHRPEFNNYLVDAQTWVDSWKERSTSI